jgi:hypothetical protein
MITRAINPFAPPAVAAPAVPTEIEHLASVRDLEAYLVAQAADKRAELGRVRALASDPSLDTGAVNAARYKAGTLEQDISLLERACSEVYSCDPWKYEPVLLDALIIAREAEAPQEDIDRLRALIRAGSWMQYQRQDEEAVLAVLRRLRRREPASWEARLAAAEAQWEARETGPALEPAVRPIEDLSLRAWLMLKQAAGAHGLDHLSDASHVRMLRDELQDLRIARDALYFRRLYPNIARKGFV